VIWSSKESDPWIKLGHITCSTNPLLILLTEYHIPIPILYILGVASKMPFKSRLFKSPKPLLLCAAFFTYPSYLFGIELEPRKLARTGNLLPPNRHLAGNPARQSRSVHAVNKYSEICSNLLRNINQ
jgi:hypothetical protein